MPSWLCTYRLQINADFDFEDLAEVASYLSALGVSHAYLSPILRAARGSTHGYDVADATQINPEWGGEEVYTRANLALSEHGIGQLLDIVPNHMSTLTPANPWWWDVLKNGPASEYFHFFDFGWNSDRRNFQPLRIPVLEDRYPRVLEAGKIVLTRSGSEFRVVYGSSAFPIAAHSNPWVAKKVAYLAGLPRTQRLADAFSKFPSTEFRVSFEDALQENGFAERFDAALEKLNDDRALLHELLDQQYYRLAYWATANESWFYRRFFDINTLAGLRIEQEDVFRVRHRRELQLARNGVIDGVRIDHIDGLRHPARYLEALRNELPGCGIWVEKILGEGEPLPTDWPIEGTTGYEYLNELNGLFVQPAAEPELTRIYQQFTGDTSTYAETLDTAKREVVRNLFGGELTDLINLFKLASEPHAHGRDWSRRDIEGAIVEYIVALPLYRTYVETGVLSETDAATIDNAIREASERRGDIEPELFDFLNNLLRLELTDDYAREFVLRCQQLSGPAMAKGAEDTSFYRYVRLLSLNEVGGNPSNFGSSIDRWHAFAAHVSKQWPQTLITTSTHDTKRGEDARARLNVLTEAPGEWEQLVLQLQEVLSRNSDLLAPDPRTRYVFFQSVVGSWPLTVERAIEYMRKATREAKLETSWTAPNGEYDQLLELYVRTAMHDKDFIAAVEAFVERIRVAGLRKSIAQTVFKLTAPGVPDIYRGSEACNFSLVDPDNRRPVDFARLHALLDRVKASDYDAAWEKEEPDLAKLWFTQRALAVRREYEATFSARDTYTPLYAEGDSREDVVAYLRGGDICVVAGRWFLSQNDGFSLQLPPGTWRNAWTGAEVSGCVTSEVLFECSRRNSSEHQKYETQNQEMPKKSTFPAVILLRQS